MVDFQVIKLVVVLALLNASSASFQHGMRAILFYTYDDAFAGADFLVQQVNNISFDSLVSNKNLTSSPRTWNNAYELIALMDGRCDISMQCQYKRYTTRGPTTTTTPRTTTTTTPRTTTTRTTTTPRSTTARLTNTTPTRFPTTTVKSATVNGTSPTATTTNFAAPTTASNASIPTTKRA